MTPTDKIRAALVEATKPIKTHSSFCLYDGSSNAFCKTCHAHFDRMEEALRELDGMCLVPMEPTGTQMITGGKKHQPNKHGEHETLHSLLARETYKAMIAPYVKGE